MGGVESLTEGSWPFDQTSEPNGSTPMATLDAESYYPEKPKGPNYLKFTALEDNCIIGVYNSFTSSVDAWYSRDKGKTWEELPFDFSGSVQLQHKGDYILVKGQMGGDDVFVIYGRVAASGDLNTVANEEGGNIQVNYRYILGTYMGGGGIADVSKLILPSDNEKADYVGLFEQTNPNREPCVMSKDGKNFIFKHGLTLPLEYDGEIYNSFADIAMSSMMMNGRGFSSVVTIIVLCNDDNLGYTSGNIQEFIPTSGKEYTISASPNFGYDLVKWQSSSDGVTWSDIPEATGLTYTFNLTKDGDYYFKAIFGETPYVWVQTSSETTPWSGGTATSTPKLKVEKGNSASVTLTATPNDGFEFVKWRKSTAQNYWETYEDIPGATTATYTDTIDSQYSNIHYLAVFQPINN